MRLIEKSNSHVSLGIFIYELEAFKNAFEEVNKSISRRALPIRLGCSIAEFENLYQTISALLLRNNANDVLINEIKFNSSFENVRILRQILNEVCNGINVIGFKEKIGIEREQLRECMRILKLY